MSGIVALVGADGAPVDARLLERLTAALAVRGPDGAGTVVRGEAGLGHAHLAVGAGPRSAQPATLDGDVWIAADARIDARAELVAALEPLARRDLAEAADAELLLHAYRAWGERCVERLLGDFAFVVWDGPRRRLFAARDPFGVKLLYYRAGPRGLVVGNTLGCLRLHPDVSDRLDASAIGSVLLWAENWDLATTTFADVRAVPPGHTLVWSARRPAPAVRRWWELPEETAPLRYDDRRDYVDEFSALLERAVEDRLRTGAAAVFMSGGLDSPLIAAVAKGRLAGGGITALTVVHDELGDPERRWSTLAADHLGIPIRHFAADALYSSWQWMLATDAPEPAVGPANEPARSAYRAVEGDCRVILSGWDGDALLDLRLGALWRGRLRRGELGSLARELAWHARRGRIPRLGVRAALARLRARRRTERGEDGFPPWLAPDFARAEGLLERWREAAAEDAPARSARAPAWAALASPAWRSVLDPCDPGMSGVAIEQRHPLLDLRLVRFALALPLVPWCVDKHLFREAARGLLPESVRTRPKTPLQGDPVGAGAARACRDVAPHLTAELSEYVDVPRYLGACEALRVADPAARPLAYAAFNTFALNGWLGSPVRRAAPAF